MSKEEITITKEKQVAILFQGDLLDYFAGQALTGLFAMCANAKVADVLSETGYGTMDEDLSRRAYACADAMLAERERRSK